MSTKNNTSQILLASFGRHQKLVTNGSVVLYPVLRHLNMVTLAIIMFVTFALMSINRDNRTETRQATPCRTSSHQAGIDNFGLRTEAFTPSGQQQNNLN